ncbi:MAG: tetratricopeptide repeat protein [Prevotellaceae bacterium]|jgi:tetratricopeptide (TPR) repeat protein|nr:tetratricopeptide repeat protein [Prevotellaceae bacterium]
MRVQKIVFTIVGLFLACYVYPQSASFSSKNEYMHKAVDLYEKEMYRSAQEQLTEAREQANPGDNILLADIVFYDAMCALETKQSNASALTEAVLGATPRNPHYNRAAYGYAKYLFEDEKYGEAKKWFTEVNSNDIPKKNQAEYYFKMGYCYYRSGISGDRNTATNYFRRVKEERNIYGDAATYYYSHIEYENGNHATASKGFERLRNNPNYASVIPYYSMQIAFAQKDYDKVIEEGTDFIIFASEKRKNEIARLVSEAYLYKGDVAKSLSFFHEYEKGIDRLTREDNYLKAYIQYKNQLYTEAINTFKGIEPRSDSVSQLRNYYMGDSYLNTNNKPEALKAFMQASKLNFDKDITENAAFNYAKLSIEVNNDEKPVNEFLKAYPNNSKSDELKTFMAEVEVKRGNYSNALDILQSIQNPSPSDRDAVHRISYAYGLDLMEKKNYGEASQMFDYSLRSTQFNNLISALAIYWKAESEYKRNNYSAAASQYEDFINTSGRFKNTQEYRIAHYNIGYCYFKQQQYDNALRWFNKYITFETSNRKTVYLGDTYNRIGDCYFKKRDFQQASDNYIKSQDLNSSNPDYSAYQKALSLGFTSTAAAKIKALDSMLNSYPKSPYVPAALYEKGRAYTQLSKYNDASNAFQRIINTYKTSSYYPKTLVEMGLIQVNEGNADKALSYYQQVVEKSPDAPEAKDALEGIKNIYIDQNRMDEYFAYANRIGQTVKSTAEKDELVFTAAEKQYQSGECDKALSALKRYLTEFPDAVSKTAANFYIADCALRSGDNKSAANSYSYVINQPQSDFTEMAWFGYAKVNLMLENYTKAIESFEKLKTISQTPSILLDAEVGCMRAYLAVEQYEKAFTSASKVAASKNIPAELTEEAEYIRARSLQQTDKSAEALEIYRTLAKDYKKAADAEAKYRIIEILYDSKKYKDSENEVYNFSENKSANQYWLAKAFITLGDIYVQQKDYFQAKATYKSIIDGYPRKDDGIKDEATKRYSEIENKN